MCRLLTSGVTRGRRTRCYALGRGVRPGACCPGLASPESPNSTSRTRNREVSVRVPHPPPMRLESWGLVAGLDLRDGDSHEVVRDDDPVGAEADRDGRDDVVRPWVDLGEDAKTPRLLLLVSATRHPDVAGPRRDPACLGRHRDYGDGPTRRLRLGMS